MRLDSDLARAALEGDLAFLVGSAISMLPPAELPAFDKMKEEMIAALLRRASAAPVAP